MASRTQKKQVSERPRKDSHFNDALIDSLFEDDAPNPAFESDVPPSTTAKTVPVRKLASKPARKRKRSKSVLKALPPSHSGPHISRIANISQDVHDKSLNVVVSEAVEAEDVEILSITEARRLSKKQRLNDGREAAPPNPSAQPKGVASEGNSTVDEPSKDTSPYSPTGLPQKRHVESTLQYRRSELAVPLKISIPPLSPSNAASRNSLPSADIAYESIESPLEPVTPYNFTETELRGATPVDDPFRDASEAPSDADVAINPFLSGEWSPSTRIDTIFARQLLLDALEADRELIHWQRKKIARDAVVRNFIRDHPKFYSVGAAWLYDLKYEKTESKSMSTTKDVTAIIQFAVPDANVTTSTEIVVTDASVSTAVGDVVADANVSTATGNAVTDANATTATGIVAMDADLTIPTEHLATDAYVNAPVTFVDRPRDLTIQRSLLKKAKARYLKNRERLVESFTSSLLICSNYFRAKVEEMIENEAPKRVARHEEGDFEMKDESDDEEYGWYERGSGDSL